MSSSALVNVDSELAKIKFGLIAHFQQTKLTGGVVSTALWGGTAHIQTVFSKKLKTDDTGAQTAVPPPMAARTPPLGWSSWNAFRGSIDEERIMNTSHLLVSTGLRDAGYVYVNLDDCWMDRFRDNETGELRAGRGFPSGMKKLGENIHALGLKYGLCSDRGYRTCQGLSRHTTHARPTIVIRMTLLTAERPVIHFARPQVGNLNQNCHPLY